MTLREAEQQRRLAVEREERRVMSFAEWCELNNLSRWTARRLIKAGKGPAITQISDRLIGVTVRANREWQQSRERA
jgi:predicted site-specific integrase-resolvase